MILWAIVMGIVGVFAVCAGIAVAVTTGGAAFFSPDLSPTATFTTVVAVGATLFGILLGPVGMAAMTLVYYDIRIRSEGLDLQILAEEMERSAS